MFDKGQLNTRPLIIRRSKQCSNCKRSNYKCANYFFEFLLYANGFPPFSPLCLSIQNVYNDIVIVFKYFYGVDRSNGNCVKTFTCKLHLVKPKDHFFNSYGPTIFFTNVSSLLWCILYSFRFCFDVFFVFFSSKVTTMSSLTGVIIFRIFFIQNW